MTAPPTYFSGFDSTGPTARTAGTPYGEYWGGKGAMKGFQQGLSGDIVGRTQREHYLSGLFDNALANPTGTADLFGKYFQTAAEGYSAPALRDFTGAIKGVSANTARRFGGNASTEENRQVSGAGDTFSRNLTEALARLAPEQVAAGQAYTNELGSAQSAAAGQSDTLKSLLLASLQSTVNTGGTDWGKILGQIAGTVGGTLIGGPGGGAVGGQIGGDIGGAGTSVDTPVGAGAGAGAADRSLGAAPWDPTQGNPPWVPSGSPRLY